MVRQQPGKKSSFDLQADRAHALTIVSVSRETAARLDALVGLVLQWQEKTNLIGASTVAKIWTRHVADSLQLLSLAAEARTWMDLGSGGGFPGLVIGCALTSGCTIHLVESNKK